jgi:hypothetical protein
VTGGVLRQTFVVFRKEIRDSSRDRRALVAIAFSVLVGPAVIAFMVDRIVDRERRADEVQIAVTGGEHAPVLPTSAKSGTGTDRVWRWMSEASRTAG